MGSLASGCSEIEGLAPSPGVEVITTRRIRFLIGLSGGPAAASIAGTVSSSLVTTVRMACTSGRMTNWLLPPHSVSAIVSRCWVFRFSWKIAGHATSISTGNPMACESCWLAVGTDLAISS